MLGKSYEKLNFVHRTVGERNCVNSPVDRYSKLSYTYRSYSRSVRYAACSWTMLVQV
jgi:hypothetical protein